MSMSLFDLISKLIRRRKPLSLQLLQDPHFITPDHKLSYLSADIFSARTSEAVAIKIINIRIM